MFTANTGTQNGINLRENSGVHFSDGEVTQLVFRWYWNTGVKKKTEQTAHITPM